MLWTLAALLATLLATVSAAPRRGYRGCKSTLNVPEPTLIPDIADASSPSATVTPNVIDVPVVTNSSAISNGTNPLPVNNFAAVSGPSDRHVFAYVLVCPSDLELTCSHFMVGFVGGYSQQDWTRDIKLAASKGIDGFANLSNHVIHPSR